MSITGTLIIQIIVFLILVGFTMKFVWPPIAARAEAEQQTVKAREALREQVAALAVKGAEQILRKEVNAGVHAELLDRLKTEL